MGSDVGTRLFSPVILIFSDFITGFLNQMVENIFIRLPSSHIGGLQIYSEQQQGRGCVNAMQANVVRQQLQLHGISDAQDDLIPAVRVADIPQPCGAD